MYKNNCIQYSIVYIYIYVYIDRHIFSNTNYNIYIYILKEYYSVLTFIKNVFANPSSTFWHASMGIASKSSGRAGKKMRRLLLR